MKQVLTDEMTAKFLVAAISALRNNVVPALATPEARINADLVSRVLYMLHSRFSRRGDDLEDLLSGDKVLLDDIHSLLFVNESDKGSEAQIDESSVSENQSTSEFSGLERLEQQVFDTELKIIDNIPELLALSKTQGSDKDKAINSLRAIVDLQGTFLAAQDSDILKGSFVCYQGGRIDEERPFPRPKIYGAELTAETLEQHLQVQFPGAKVQDFSIMAGGFSKGTIFFTLLHRGGNSERLVIRKDLPVHFISSVAKEFPLLKQLYEMNFPVAEPRWLEDDPVPFGGRFLVSSRVDGSTDISAWAGDVTMVEKFARQLAKIMADLHAMKLQDLSYPDAITSLSAGKLMEQEVQRWEDSFHVSRAEARPILAMALDWIKANMPDSLYSRRGCLVHGDIGFHNMMVDDGEVTALLDWEFAHPGDPLEDLLYVKPFIDKVMDWETFKSYYYEYGGEECSAEEEFFYTIWAKTRNPVSSVPGGAVFSGTMHDNIQFASAPNILARYLELEAGQAIVDALG